MYLDACIHFLTLTTCKTMFILLYRPSLLLPTGNCSLVRCNSKLVILFKSRTFCRFGRIDRGLFIYRIWQAFFHLDSTLNIFVHKYNDFASSPYKKAPYKYIRSLPINYTVELICSSSLNSCSASSWDICIFFIITATASFSPAVFPSAMPSTFPSARSSLRMSASLLSNVISIVIALITSSFLIETTRTFLYKERFCIHLTHLI